MLAKLLRNRGISSAGTLVILAALLFGLLVLVSRFSNSFGSLKDISCRGCNVIIIGVDTLRADHVHAFGYERDTTPALDSLVSKGFSFSQAISPASWTVPAFMSVFTGVYPSVHKVTNKFTVFTKEKKELSNLKTLSPSTRTLAQVLQDSGYATGGFTGDAGVSAKFGYNQGFDTYTDEVAFGGIENSEKHALDWLDGLKGKRFFMFFHGYDLHGQFAISENYKSVYAPSYYAGPYKGTSKEEGMLRENILTPQGISLTPADAEFWKAWYDGKIHDADARLQRFLNELDSRGILQNTVIVVLSDHGEEFYEHRGFDHGHSLYDELIHVPLIFVVPGADGGKVVKSQVTTLDVAPTLLSILGITPDNAFAEQIKDRRNLIAYFNNPGASGYDVFSETDYRDYTHKRSLRTADGWKYILTLENGKEELYNVNIDRGEKDNLILSRLDKAEALRTELRTHLQNDLKADISTKASTGCLPVYQGECE